MEERITQGMSVQLTDATPIVNPIGISEIKDYLGIATGLHDTKLNMLASACRIECEHFCNLSILSRAVVVSWQKLYDFEILPYGPVVTDIDEITVTDLEDVVIESDKYKITGVGGLLSIVGDFPNGVKVTYNAGIGSANVNNSIKQALINSVVSVFLGELSVNDAVHKYCRNLSI